MFSFSRLKGYIPRLRQSIFTRPKIQNHIPIVRNFSGFSDSSAGGDKNGTEVTVKNVKINPRKRLPISKEHSVSSIQLDETQALIIPGQGVIEVDTAGIQPEGWLLLELRGPNNNAFILQILKDSMVFSVREMAKEEVLFRKKQEGIGIEVGDLTSRELISYYPYWFSLDSYNGMLRYGKGEMRIETTLASYDFSKQRTYYPWAKNIMQAFAKASSEQVIQKVKIWRDPVVVNTPLIVVPEDDLTMGMAAAYMAFAPSTLTEECQQLYGNVSGKSFTLNTPDFPDFIEAIEYSIKNPEGWCYKRLLEKATEFGEKNEKATYLRITLGSNQGNSPGVPYVMEIWPRGHYSPIHNHGGTNAVVKVLHGEITVELFSFLSTNNQKPFSKKTFIEGDVTWITPSLNQTHRLINQNEDGPTCITIQCYLYNKEDRFHYEYFDYIDNSGTKIENYAPDSDMDFLEFRQVMKLEWKHKKQATKPLIASSAERNEEDSNIANRTKGKDAAMPSSKALLLSGKCFDRNRRANDSPLKKAENPIEHQGQRSVPKRSTNGRRDR